MITLIAASPQTKFFVTFLTDTLLRDGYSVSASNEIFFFSNAHCCQPFMSFYFIFFQTFYQNRNKHVMYETVGPNRQFSCIFFNVNFTVKKYNSIFSYMQSFSYIFLLFNRKKTGLNWKEGKVRALKLSSSIFLRGGGESVEIKYNIGEVGTKK